MHTNQKFLRRARALLLGLYCPALLLACVPAWGMDIDIYTINANAGAPAPNVLIVLDNTSDWSEASQHWPNATTGGKQVQGQAEVAAIKQMLAGLTANVNVGVMEFVPTGSTTDGGYIRFAVTPVGPNQTGGPANNTTLSNVTTTIYNDINGPTEKRPSGAPYGDLMYDVYNYYTGVEPYACSTDVPTSLADSRGYNSTPTLPASTSQCPSNPASIYNQFFSPLSAAANCARSYVIFIGNPPQSGPTSDSAANTTALSKLGGSTTEIPLPGFTTVSGTPGSGLPGTSTPTGTFVTDTGPWNADEWARFLYQHGVPVGAAVGGVVPTQYITTYTIDVFYDAPVATQSELLASMASAGGGRYVQATSQSAILSALQSIFIEITAANSTFASASLPISATTQSKNDNQVYIGMFRPDPNSLPRWYGNLKRYQLATFSGAVDLADINGLNAVDTTTGFLVPCAVSWWTTDSTSSANNNPGNTDPSGDYWANVSGTGTSQVVNPRIFYTIESTPGLSWLTAGNDTTLAAGLCGGSTNPYSDIPDGATVEKGGVAEVLRNATSRTMLTLSGTSLVPFTATTAAISSNSTINTNIVNFIQGQDVTGEINGVASTTNRPSIHGDVIHSRPLPIDYGGTTGVVIYYGANDGTYRAVNAATGGEDWSFVAPEFFPTLQRLLDNSPVVASATTPKGFFFDGSTGLYAGANSPTVWIYPAMRRGGRMVYALNVSTPTSPSFMWKDGCPTIGSNIGCTSAALANIGQTWSTPAVAFLPGYSTTAPIVAMGGGYDTCEDQDITPATSGFCAGTTGNAFYVMDAKTGNVIQAFSSYLDNNGASYALPRSIATDVSYVDINYDGIVDAAYVADTGGNLYRVNFSDANYNPLPPASWTMTRVAYTNGAGRKFLFTPATLAYNGNVYLAIGSGDREHPLITNYPYTTPITNRFYVYLDNPARTTSTNLDGDNMLNSTEADSATCTSATVTPGSTFYGWYMDLTANGVGEQTVTSALIVSGTVTFSTNRPVSSTNSCVNSLGEARGYWLDLLNGSGAISSTPGVCGGAQSSTFTGGGLPPSPVMATVDINGLQTTVVLGAVQQNGGASSPIGAQQSSPPITATRSRVYWRFMGGDTH